MIDLENSHTLIRTAQIDYIGLLTISNGLNKTLKSKTKYYKA